MKAFNVILLLLLSTATLQSAFAANSNVDSEREALPGRDGWAASGSGTSGGANARTKRISTVRTRRELIAALNDGAYPAPKAPSNEPKIVHIEGVVDVNVDDSQRALSCKDYARNGYTIEAFSAAYDPAVWGREPPQGAVESARHASQKAQEERVRIRVGSNTTIVGNRNAALQGIWLDIQNQSNVIVRNIAFSDTHDCFPQWEPKDGEGAWNSVYDFISVRGSDHIWIDHNSFDDGALADSKQPYYFGKHLQIHDGAVDVTEGSDLVTISWNRFANHDKVMLIGSSDTRLADRGKLRVTLHHNLFDNVGQRMPRVRFGRVHVYNNLYRIVDDKRYQYSWGAGFESRIYAQNNVFVSDAKIEPQRLVRAIKGAALFASGTLLDGSEVDALAAFNMKHDPNLIRDVGWQPSLHSKIDASHDVAAVVGAGAGPRMSKSRMPTP